MTTTTSSKTPAYVPFCQMIAAALEASGVQLVPQKTVIDGLPGNKGWVCFQSQATEHKVYVPRDSDRLGNLHTTLSVDPATPGFVDHRGKAPGKIESFFAPDLEKVLRHLVPLLAGETQRLRADRQRASQATPAARVGTMADVLSE